MFPAEMIRRLVPVSSVRHIYLIKTKKNVGETTP